MPKGYKKGNNFIIEDNVVKMELKRNKGNESKWTIFDLEDYEKVKGFPYTWFARLCTSNNKWYCVANTMKDGMRTTIHLHTYLTNLHGGHEEVPDHVNHDGLDNRKDNLRIINNGENLQNRSGKNINNQSGYRNVAYIKNAKYPYRVQIMVDGKNTVLGNFSDVDEAGTFAKRMRTKYYGEFEGES